MEFTQVVMGRYAAKKFDGKIIPQEKVEELFELIRMAPTSWNLQPYKVKVVTDKAVKEQLLSLSWNQEQVTTCSHLLVFCADSDVMPRIDRLGKLMLETGASKETVDTYTGLMRGSFEEKSETERLSWAQRQAYLALENALLGAKALGFDSCPMEGFDPAGYARVLGLPKNLVASAVCPIGFAADSPRPKVRFPKDEMFF